MKIKTLKSASTGGSVSRSSGELVNTRNRSEAKAQPNAEPGPGHAFTLLELIVVIGLLAFLGSIAATGLTKTRPTSQAVQCLQNLRQLGSAWVMYADDNAGRLAPNADGGGGTASTSPAWVVGWLDYSVGNPANTNTDFLVNHGRYPYGAYLGPYVENPAVFKCPADKSVARIQGQVLPRVRSYSMNGRVGENSRTWTVPSAYRLYQKLSDIISPRPAGLMVIVDEREDSINDGCFQVDPDTRWQLIDYPSCFHDGAAGFVFADSHSEMKRWHDPRTMPPLRQFMFLALNINLPGDVDVQWLQEHCSARSQ